MTERLKNRVASLLDSLGAGAYEREEVIGLSLLAALAGGKHFPSWRAGRW